MSLTCTTESRTYFLCLIFLFVAVLSTEVDAKLWGFSPISNNSGVSGVAATQLTLDVTEYASDPDPETETETERVLFTFSNIGPLPSVLTGVYFDDGALLGISEIVEQPPDVDFSYPVEGQENFPEGGNQDPPFETTAGFSAGIEKGKGGVLKGVNPGESVGIVFTLKDDYDLDGVIAAMYRGLNDPLNDSLRVGLRVQSLGEDGEFSDAFMHAPVPGAVLLGLLGLGVAGVKLRKFA